MSLRNALSLRLGPSDETKIPPPRRAIKGQRSTRAAFSLLEVILAVALTAVVISLVAGAIDFHLRQLTVRRAKIEQSQLARAILRRMANDIHATIVDRPIDFSAAQMLVQGAGGGGRGGGGGGDSGEGGGEGGGGDDEGDELDSTETEGTESSATDDLIDSGVLPATPGVYGTSFELQIDVSRIPRYEEYAFTGDYAVQSTTSLSDIKTVTYFMFGNAGGVSMAASGVDPGMLDTLGMSPDQVMLMGGLARREVPRSVARYASTNGNFSVLDNQVELLAPEVTMVEFRYFDGQQWLNTWDSEEQGGIPMAIEISIVLNPNQQPQDGNFNSSNNYAANSSAGGVGVTSFGFNPDDYYRLVVHLPPAEVVTEEDEAEETAEASAR